MKETTRVMQVEEIMEWLVNADMLMAEEAEAYLAQIENAMK